MSRLVCNNEMCVRKERKKEKREKIVREKKKEREERKKKKKEPVFYLAHLDTHKTKAVVRFDEDFQLKKRERVCQQKGMIHMKMDEKK